MAGAGSARRRLTPKTRHLLYFSSPAAEKPERCGETLQFTVVLLTVDSNATCRPKSPQKIQEFAVVVHFRPRARHKRSQVGVGLIFRSAEHRSSESGRPKNVPDPFNRRPISLCCFATPQTKPVERNY